MKTILFTAAAASIFSLVAIAPGQAASNRTSPRGPEVSNRGNIAIVTQKGKINNSVVSQGNGNFVQQGGHNNNPTLVDIKGKKVETGAIIGGGIKVSIPMGLIP